MKLALFILLVSAAAFGQARSLIGSVDKIAGGAVTVKTPRGSFTIHVDDRTEVAGDIKAGAEISVRCEPQARGALRAIQIWAKLVTFSATVRYIDDDDLEVLTIPNAEYSREEHRIVHILADTAFGSTRKDLSEGQKIRVVGLDVGRAAVDAARITIYNADMPVTR